MLNWIIASRYLLAILFIVPSLTGALTLEAHSSSKCHLKMGWVSWPPYQYLNSDNQLTGSQLALFQSIATEAGCQLTFINGSWSELQLAIKDGSVDVMGDATITNERQEFAYFSNTYRTETLALYINKKNVGRFPQGQLEGLIESGFRVGLTKGNYYGSEVASLLSHPDLSKRFQRFGHTHDNYHALVNGQVDGLFDDPLIFAYTVRLLGYRGMMTRHMVVVNKAPVSLMFSKKTVDKHLVERFNSAILKVKKSADYRRLWEW